MKKTIVLFLIAFLLSAIYISPKHVKADSSINDLSFARGNNLLDISNLSFDSENVETIKNIYIGNTGANIMFQVENNEDYFSNNVQAYIVFYDIDFTVISSAQMNANQTTYNSKEYYYNYIKSPNQAFSFSICIGSFTSSFYSNSCPTLMVTYGSSPATYEAFEAATGLFDLRGSNTPTLRVSYENTLSDTDIKSLVNAYDAYDGLINNKLVVDSSTYRATPNTIGTYTINLSVTDGNNNTATGNIKISVYDSVKPIIGGYSEVSFPVNTVITDELILSEYTASDGYDGTISSSLVISSSYSKESSNVSSQNLTLSVTDSSSNTTTKQITLIIYDNVPPTVSSDETLSFSYQTSKTISEIVSDHFTYSDNIDTNLSPNVIRDTYTGNERKVGSYTVSIEVVDGAGNQTSCSIEISVLDNIVPVIYFNGNVVETLSTVQLTDKDFADILCQSLELDSGEEYEIVVLEDTYSSHQNEEGTYTYRARYKSKEGRVLEKTFLVMVTNNSYSIDYNAKKVQQLTTTEIILIVTSSVLFVPSATFLTLTIIKKAKKRPKKHNF